MRLVRAGRPEHVSHECGLLIEHGFSTSTTTAASSSTASIATLQQHCPRAVIVGRPRAWQCGHRLRLDHHCRYLLAGRAAHDHRDITRSGRRGGRPARRTAVASSTTSTSTASTTTSTSTAKGRRASQRRFNVGTAAAVWRR